MYQDITEQIINLVNYLQNELLFKKAFRW